jgi:hypothetical protein
MTIAWRRCLNGGVNVRSAIVSGVLRRTTLAFFLRWVGLARARGGRRPGAVRLSPKSLICLAKMYEQAMIGYLNQGARPRGAREGAGDAREASRARYQLRGRDARDARRRGHKKRIGGSVGLYSRGKQPCLTEKTRSGIRRCRRATGRSRGRGARSRNPWTPALRLPKDPQLLGGNGNESVWAAPFRTSGSLDGLKSSPENGTRAAKEAGEGEKGEGSGRGKTQPKKFSEKFQIFERSGFSTGSF